MGEWVSTKDRWPEGPHNFMIPAISSKYGFGLIYKCSPGDEWLFKSLHACEVYYGMGQVTHWMPLPPHPPCNDEEKAKDIQKRLDAMLVFSSSKYELFESDKRVNSFPQKQPVRRFMDELKRKNEIDITENMSGGCVKHIISTLKSFSEIGYDRLYWDGYNSTISLYKSCKCGKDKEDRGGPAV